MLPFETMPPEIYEIYDCCWDETGRPRPTCISARNVAIGKLMDLCDDYDQFIARYKLLFPEHDTTEVRLLNELQMCWHMYVKGLLRGLDALEIR